MIGISRQRKGQIKTSDGVGTTERAVFQSSVISEELFRRFEAFIEKEYQGLLDTSKIAWREGKKMTYVTSDLRTAMINIDPQEFQEAEYGVFVKNTSREQDKLNQHAQHGVVICSKWSVSLLLLLKSLTVITFLRSKGYLQEVEEKQKAMQEQQQPDATTSCSTTVCSTKQLCKTRSRPLKLSQNELDRISQNGLEEAGSCFQT